MANDPAGGSPAETARNEAEALRRLAEDARNERESLREAREAGRVAAEAARLDAEGVRQGAMTAMRETADLMDAALQQMQLVEEMRRALREIRDVNKLDVN
jgi:hypothetical protein